MVFIEFRKNRGCVDDASLSRSAPTHATCRLTKTVPFCIIRYCSIPWSCFVIQSVRFRRIMSNQRAFVSPSSRTRSSRSSSMNSVDVSPFERVIGVVAAAATVVAEYPLAFLHVELVQWRAVVGRPTRERTMSIIFTALS